MAAIMPLLRNLTSLIAVVLLIAGCSSSDINRRPIRIGVLHALSGTMAVSESPLVKALEMAVEEINESGGLLGRRVEMIVVNTRSDPNWAAQEAERLIVSEKVSALFGCWTSACRKAVKSVVERHGHLLVYPLQYEGLEESPNILYTGAAPNQQIIPAFNWATERFGRRVYLVGSDYVFPRTAHRIMREMAATTEAEIVGESFIPLGSADVAATVEEITRLKPDVVINAINGDSNSHFFKAMTQHGLTAQRSPILSLSITESETSRQSESMEGHYAAWGYFQEVRTPENTHFIQGLQRLGQNQTDDPMEASYLGIKLWAQAVRDGQSDEPGIALNHIGRQSLAAPQGIVSVDQDTRHLWRGFRIGRCRPDGRFEIIWSHDRPIRPHPYPPFRTKEFWKEVA